MAQLQKTFTVGGKSLSVSKANLSAEAELAREVLVPAGYAGTLTTRTDDDTGVITLATGAGANFTVGDWVNVYWATGHRRRMKVSSIATDAITVGTNAGDVGAGDVFPAATTAVTLSKVVIGEFRFDGNDLVLLAFSSEARGIIVLTGDDDAEDYFVNFASPDADAWDNQSSEANPVAGDTITKAWLSHSDVAAARRMKVGAAFN